MMMMKKTIFVSNGLPITLGLLLLPMLLQQIIDITVVSALNPSWRSSSTKFWNDEERHFPNLLCLRLDTDQPVADTDLSVPTQTCTQTHTAAAQVRGGSSSANKTNRANKVLQGSKSTIASTMQYWSDAFNHFASSLIQPIRNIRKPTFLQSKATRRHNELLERLQTTPIEHVTIVPNSTVVPNEVLQIAAKRAGLLGRPLQTQAVQDVARSLQQWYERKGYVLHSMTGATLQVETKTAELSVQEPISSTDPVAIVFCKEMVIDPDDGSLLTFKQYRNKMLSTANSNDKSVRKLHRAQKLNRSSLNTTFVPTSMGRTNPNRIAAALGIRPGAPFCWNPERWRSIIRSGLFQTTIRATPERMADGSVQLQLVVQEAPARNLEYGLTKSLYTDSWEGEIDFHHRNLLGGGESLGVLVRRGTQDAEPSIRVRFRDDKFGTIPGGYDVEVFSDFIGEHLEEKDGVEVEVNQSNEDYDHDELLDRKGVSMSIRSPLSSLPVANSGSATLERTSTKGGRHESVGSATLNLGPISSDLPLDARTSVFGKVTTGTRIGESSTSSPSGLSSLLPFASLTATTRQIFPLSELAAGPLVLALQHSATASTRHLPRHEANAHGVACKIRGYQGGSRSERVSNSLVGTTELRIPLKLPRGLDEASVVVFGDWCLASAGMNQKFKRRSSVGVSLRKTFQGLPIKYDISLTEDRKIGAFFGLGPDFQA